MAHPFTHTANWVDVSAAMVVTAVATYRYEAAGAACGTRGHSFVHRVRCGYSDESKQWTEDLHLSANLSLLWGACALRTNEFIKCDRKWPLIFLMLLLCKCGGNQ